MPLENSPDFESEDLQPDSSAMTDDKPAGSEILRKRVVHGALLILILGLSVLLLIRSGLTQEEVGGIDGCIQTDTGLPVQAEVQINGVSKQTYSDGCFFFADVLPGKHTMYIQIPGRSEWTIPVQVLSGQAAALGTLTAP
ncbi:MAG: hypothetical protein JXA25_16255 [Anaerolineales bacterium]|nr:hypothetical protein [Anaerolineales bacterium]